MKILNFIPNLSGGGAERQLACLAPELTRMGHEVHIAYSEDGPAIPELPGVILHRLKSSSNYDLGLLLQAVALMREIRPQLVQTWILQMDIVGGIAAKITRTKWLFREPSSSMCYPDGWKSRLRVLAGSWADAIVANSEGGVEYWSEKLPGKRCRIIRNCLPLEKIGSVSPAFPFSIHEPVPPVILYVGRLIASKNLELFLRVLTHINRTRAVLGVICGDGPERRSLEDLARKLGISDKVIFTGHLPASSVWALIKKSSVFASFSSYEGCPNTVMEAMACGCPVVVSDIPAHREILDESCAVFPMSVDALAAAKAVSSVLDEEDSAHARVLAAQERSRKWSLQEVAGDWVRVYSESVG